MKCLECNKVEITGKKRKWCSTACSVKHHSNKRAPDFTVKAIKGSWNFWTDERKFIQKALSSTDMGFISGRALSWRDAMMGRDYSKRGLK